MRPALAALLLVLVTGCGAEPRVAFEPSSDARQVRGTLVRKDDQRPVDGPVRLTVAVGGGREEVVIVPSLFTAEPPSTARLALQQKVDQLAVGDRFTATGARDAEGALVAETIEIH